MVRSITVLLVVTACTVSSIDLSTKPCPCPSGWECGPANLCIRENTTEDAGIDAAPCGRDDDNDTIDDCLDNCPAAANREQYNEDGDARGDACDLCPGDIDDGTNTDGDGVGDACDPDPASEQRILVFEGFHGGIPAGWTVQGTWNKLGDDIVVSSGVDVISSLAIKDPAPTRRTWLLGKFTIGTLHDPGTSTRYISLVRRWDPMPDNNVRCLLYQGNDTTGPTMFGIRDTGPVPGLSNLVPHAFASGQVERFVFEQNGTSYRCSNATLSVTGTTTQASANDEIGLRTRSVSGSYAWMMLVGP